MTGKTFPTLIVNGHLRGRVVDMPPGGYDSVEPVSMPLHGSPMRMRQVRYMRVVINLFGRRAHVAYCGDMSTIEFNVAMADLLLSDVAKAIIGGAMEGTTDGEQ